MNQPPEADWVRRPHADASGKLLMGLVRAPDAERARRPDMRRDVDVEIHGTDPHARTSSSLASALSLLATISELRNDAEELAPAEWRGWYLDRPDYPGLFLTGLEFHDDGTVRVLFDFGDLDLLILELHPDGRRTATVEP